MIATKLTPLNRMQCLSLGCRMDKFRSCGYAVDVKLTGRFFWVSLILIVLMSFFGWRKMQNSVTNHSKSSDYINSTEDSAQPGLGTENASRSPAPATDALSPAREPDRLRELRRVFQPFVRQVGTPQPGGGVIELEGTRIFTGDRKLSLSPSGSGVAPYLIQFSVPIDDAAKALVISLGGRIHGYLPVNALSVDLDASAAKRLAREPDVLAILPVAADYKVQPFLSHLIALNDENIPPEISVTISTYQPADVNTVVDALATLGIAAETFVAGKRWGWIRATIPRTEIMSVAALDRVQWIEEYVPPVWVNDLATTGDRMNVTNVWSTHGLTGAGQIIGHADTGLDSGNLATLHPDFAGRIVAAYDLGRPGRWDDPHGHGTHTAGSILGGGVMSTGQFRGVAFEAGLVHQSVMDAYGGLGGLPYDLNDLYAQAHADGARIHANSWGSSTYGTYTTDSRQSDEFMWDHPDMLIVFSAGNDGWDSGDGVIDPDSIGAPATAKNVLTVGAAESGRPTGSGGLSSYTYGSLWPWDYSANPIYSDYVSQPYDLLNQGMAAFSSRGPTDDGRIKPEIIAPGTDIVSTRSRYPGAGTVWGAHPNTNYCFGGGTSMSTPLTAGAAALVRQYFQDYRQHEQPSSALIKAALLHGARTIYPGQYGTNQFLEIPAARPNNVEGWGQVDLENALFPDDASWFFSDAADGLTISDPPAPLTFYATNGTVRITLLYTDYPALAGAGIKLVNDLDLVLAGPSGEIAASRDRTNISERIVADITVAGIYTARVEAINIPNGPQPYALIISGPLLEAPMISHTPLQNQYLTNQPYTVTARVTAIPEASTNGVEMYWRRGTTGTFNRVLMARSSNDLFAASIPAQPNPSEIHYYIAASNAVATARSPETGTHTFLVTRSYPLTVSASPANIFAVDPPYGVHLVASGNTVRISAPAYTNLSPGMRLTIAGWTGTGNVPSSGTSNETTIIVSQNSSIQWQWVTEYSLTQTSTVAGILHDISWWPIWSPAVTATVATERVHNYISYGLAGWRIDGARYPSPGAIADNPATNIVMYGPRVAEAVYLPASQDDNTNSLPDWWEQFYFGDNGATANVDDDNDGFTNIKEYQDRTNPRDDRSTPQPPAVAHLPLANPQPVMAPWNVDALVVDNYAVSNVSVFWQRNGGAWTSAIMTTEALTNFSGVIAAPGTNGDTFVYRIEATDFAGLKTVNGPFNFSVAYPRISSAPAAFGTIDVPADQTTNLFVTITNFGLATLHWTLDRALFYDHVESGTNAWTSTGQNNVWHIDTNRYASARSAWHFGSGPYGAYPDSAHAWLISEPVRLDAPAQLTFDHWARMEYDDGLMDDHYWDGAVVEISIDDGATFTTIDPVGGYPHRITDNPASPFAPDTPCYGETDGWEPAVFDLSAYTGENIRIRFRFGSDAYVTEEGWYIDNVRITYHDDASWTWLDVATSGSLAAPGVTNIAVTLDASALDFGERRKGTLVLEGNDPERDAPILIPVAIHNATREITVTASANGSVAPFGPVQVRAGDALQVWAGGEAFYAIDLVYTNDGAVADYRGLDASWITWPDVQSNGTLHITFAEKISAGHVPEWWLFEQGFTNASFEVEANTDHDGDGMLTWQEYVAGTDARDADSVAMKIFDVAPGDAGAVIQWLSFTNLNLIYDVLVSTNLVDGFTPVATNLPATPPVNIFTNPEAPAFNIFHVIGR